MLTTAVGTPPCSRGMCRKPPTDILLSATATSSSSRRKTGSAVMISPQVTAFRSSFGPATLCRMSHGVMMPASCVPLITSTHSVSEFCISRTARPTGSVVCTRTGDCAGSSARRAWMNSGPCGAWSDAGWSSERRSCPQFSQVSTPSMLSCLHSGQIMLGSAVDRRRASAPPGRPTTGGRRLLLHRPGIAFEEDLPQVAFALLGDRLLDLLRHEFVVRRLLHGAQHAGRHGVLRPLHAAEQE